MIRYWMSTERIWSDALEPSSQRSLKDAELDKQDAVHRHSGRLLAVRDR